MRLFTYLLKFIYAFKKYKASLIKVLNTQKLNKLYNQIGIQVHLTGIRSSCAALLRKCSFEKNFDSLRIYPSVHDAITYLDAGRSSSASENLSSTNLEVQVEIKLEAIN